MAKCSSADALRAAVLLVLASAARASDVVPTELAAPAAPTVSSPAYQVECAPGTKAAEQCTVDAATYVGWRTFHTHCFQCHGGSALGSTFAPNLLDRVNQNVDLQRLSDVLEHGFTGRVGAMPAFAKNTQVLNARENIYLYLRARADGVLPPGRPVRK